MPLLYFMKKNIFHVLITFLALIKTEQIYIQGKPNKTEHVRTFDISTSIDGDVWKKEKPLPSKVGNDLLF